MDELVPCPKCQTQVKTSDYFCFFCGRNLHPKPPSTAITAVIWLFIKTILLPPFGIWWGVRYLRQSDLTSRVIGLVVVVITIVETVWVTQATMEMVNTINTQMGSQLQMYGL